MKKTKLLIDYTYDFELIGLISSMREYKVAWGINKNLNINLTKERDLELLYAGNRKLLISNYSYALPHGEIRLFKNRAVEVINSDNYYLAPELPHFDFIFMVDDPTKNIEFAQLKKRLQEVENIEYVAEIDIQQLKSKDNFLF